MKTGYGRGYYGIGQLAPRPPRRPRSGWVTLAVIAGAGAVWYLWPRKSRELPTLQTSTSLPPPQSPAHEDLGREALDQLARSRGFDSTKLYEDSIVANAKELQAAGAEVVLAPHLQHLRSRLES